MRVKGYHFLFVIIVMAALWPCHAARAQDSIESDRVYPLISAYIYNFTQFTSWPDSAIKGAFTICVLGHDPFGAALNPIKSKEVKGNSITLKRYGSGGGGSITSCNVLFIADSESGHIGAILASLQGTPVLTMSDIEGFADEGGMVEFKPENGKVGIWIALPAVKAAGISISSKLLSLVHIKE